MWTHSSSIIITIIIYKYHHRKAGITDTRRNKRLSWCVVWFPLPSSFFFFFFFLDFFISKFWWNPTQKIANLVKFTLKKPKFLKFFVKKWWDFPPNKTLLVCQEHIHPHPIYKPLTTCVYHIQNNVQANLLIHIHNLVHPSLRDPLGVITRSVWENYKKC